MEGDVEDVAGGLPPAAAVEGNAADVGEKCEAELGGLRLSLKSGPKMDANSAPYWLQSTLGAGTKCGEVSSALALEAEPVEAEEESTVLGLSSPSSRADFVEEPVGVDLPAADEAGVCFGGGVGCGTKSN